MLTSNYHYLRFELQPKVTSEISIRQNIHQALLDSFGITGGSIHLDILWVSDDGLETVVRVDSRDARKVLAAATSSSFPKFQLVKESSFLPSLLARDMIL
ncbi:MAG: hypothetical protein NXY57DRAFT_890881 [Lentinula lateritia]|uniref:Ribonucleases P/MRP subunit Pop8-like domain-containing protein n=1 Tax=Lentinula lateritia TaxID=40482 RepID=A0ABQ8VE63_9AGAR|nr:MAG: hypothetical protein NXY57DRAFT_890881 [Lentinula lateritia]KAJ4491065.1 hypothetical protein C8R41DRAFT_766496 [Lentinula lateritia]